MEDVKASKTLYSRYLFSPRMRILNRKNWRWICFVAFQALESILNILFLFLENKYDLLAKLIHSNVVSSDIRASVLLT